MGAIAHHESFEYIRARKIPNLQLNVQEFVHKRTGAVHYHLDIDHAENVFMVAFRTVPKDSTGVAHILEHTTLCGSERYPVRDPFFLMIRRSLNTFMNAFTASDYTAYPFASENQQDFKNLLDIYLDAVFFPLLDPLDFAQEGHRLEFEEPEDTSSNLVYKGVVYNEMKGDQSSVVSLLYETVKSTLFPTSTYHHNSGGEPADIPSLSYEQLVDFHKSHYHPSNAIFMTFGSISAEQHQTHFEQQALQRFAAAEAKIEVQPEIAITQTQRIESPFPVTESDTDTDKKSHVVMGWKLDRNTNLETLLKCNLLSDVLLDTSASPLRLALENTALATAPSPLCGLEETNFEMSFYCGVEGADRLDADQIEALILETLEQIESDGVEVEHIEACLHQLELSHREIGGDGYPYGLQLMFSCLAATVHRSDPIALLDLDQVLEKLREDIQEKDFIPKLIREFLLDNAHRVRVTLYPDAQYDSRQEQTLADALATTKSQLTAEQAQEIVQQTRDLKIRQARTEPIDVLPKVTLADVGAPKQPPTSKVTKHGSVDLTSYEVGTNGLTYQQVVSDLPSLSPKLMQLLQIYSQVVTEVGSGQRNYLETQRLQHAQTGGIGSYSSFRPDMDNPQLVNGKYTISSRCLSKNLSAMNELLMQTCFEPNFAERSRIADLISQLRIRRDASIANNGHGLAMSAAGAWFRPIPLLSHYIHGLEGTLWLRRLDDAIADSDQLDETLHDLVLLNQALADQSKQLLLISEQAVVDPERYVQGWQKGHTDHSEIALAEREVPQFQAWRTTTQVNHCAQVFQTVAENHEDAPSLNVLAGVLRNGYLHGKIREQGGAYGGGATHDAANGLFRFYSYRDPNLEQTFDSFQDSIDWVHKETLAFDLVEESILGIVSSLDAPGSPAGEAKQHFQQTQFGRTVEKRRQFRERILSTTVEDIKRVATTYLTMPSAKAVVTDHKTNLNSAFIEKTI